MTTAFRALTLLVGQHEGQVPKSFTLVDQCNLE